MKKNFVAFLLIFTILSTLALVTASADEPPLLKSETVYAKLAADGGVTGVYVVNSFEIPAHDKLYSFADYGNYEKVTNLTDSAPISVTDGKVEVTAADEGMFYYQGNMPSGTELPWDVRIAHTLDGTVVAPSELAGKSGRWGMTIEIAPNPRLDFEQEQFTLQVQVSLDQRKFFGVDSGNASVAAAGYSNVLNFTMMNGEGSAAVSADVKDFELASVQIAAVHAELPIDIDAIADSIDVDASAVTEQITQLQGAVAQLNDGASELARTGKSLVEGANAIADAAVADASAQLQAQLSAFGVEVPELTRANYAEVLDGLALQLPVAKTQFDAAKEQIGGIVQFADGVAQYVAGVGELSGGLKQLNTELSGFDIGAAIDEAMDGIMDSVLADFMPGEYVPDSFAAPGHTVSNVQFVIRTDAIEIPEPEPVPVAEVKLTFWQRLLKLFGLYTD
jgi:X-X-X-Leu-X-X-Gly heptad repeat protein